MAGARGVLVTRPQPGADATAARLRALGRHAVVAPFLRVVPMPARLPDAAGLQAILVTSAQALPGLVPGDTMLLAVGNATADSARRRGFAVVHSAGGDATDLCRLATRLLEPSGAPLLLAVGRGQGAGLAGSLRGQGFRVLRRTIYAAGPVPRFPDAAAEALRDAALDAALFLSAATAQAFVRLLPADLATALAGVDALTIGGSTAAALHGLPWRRVRVAACPTADGVLALL